MLSSSRNYSRASKLGRGSRYECRTRWIHSCEESEHRARHTRPSRCPRAETSRFPYGIGGASRGSTDLRPNSRKWMPRRCVECGSRCLNVETSCHTRTDRTRIKNRQNETAPTYAPHASAIRSSSPLPCTDSGGTRGARAVDPGVPGHQTGISRHNHPRAAR